MELERNALHVSSGDAPFTRRMRVHQSWYRKYVLNLRPGLHPTAKDKKYGNILETEDGKDGRNFLNDEIHAVVQARLAQGKKGIEEKRLRCNMLGSQPMCFNLFGPLAQDHDLATRLMSCLKGFPSGARVTDVRFEFAPDPKTHLKDNSAFDAFLEYQRPDGRKGFFGIETKLTEPFSQRKYSFHDGYSRWPTKPQSWWVPDLKSKFQDLRFNQLCRNHLLTFAALNQDPKEYAEGYCAVVWHPGDLACRDALTAYRDCLREGAGGSLVEWPLDKFVKALEGAELEPARREWLTAFRQRYLDLDESEAAWEAVIRTTSVGRRKRT